jgi:2-keto-4-pentenoate hydratase/2-oxohepta-3-ene-1,7-dioic acid hydratase in catechol pathway
VRAIGVNYKDHAVSVKTHLQRYANNQDEMGIPRPTLPVMFYKSNQTITHPNSPVLVSKVAQREELDYEVELAIVIGRDCKDATLDNAYDYVTGYTCANDITARKHQAESSQWSFSKSRFYHQTVS